MLCGTTPWPSKTQYELLKNIKNKPVYFPYNIKISPEVREFILGCLEVNESDRFEWFA